ncbi:hypothetical protein KDA_60470 [Dictyobacter alpinus]|uniref:non-specific serine/threonine protein kinase n=1 Tax=Dictyobacter alpinus TaxID=2014873 RepID=A0A402BGR1_9CHLR|nr:protein kinase [Dictyobacter alpinus]GCE30563.1 hypothetical protein KDA_60470 [Dictyobacter alpinus]
MAYDGSKMLGNYRLLELLGQGGFADVYLGEHIYLKTSAAIKVLRVQLDRDALESFLAEARTIARLRHPHITIVHDFGIEHDVPFLVMGYAPYGSLRRLHPMGSIVPLATVVGYVKQMAQALQYAHVQQIIHRDVKPENILLGEQQQLLLSDFGIAVATQSIPGNSLVPRAKQSAAIGTTTYMAPELFTADAVFASDQYSLAIVAYEWLCGAPPFSGSDMEVALQHVHIAVPSLSDKAPEVTSEVEKVIMKALAKQPRERYPSILDFATAFEQALSARKVEIVSSFSADKTEAFPFPAPVTPPPLLPSPGPDKSMVNLPPSVARTRLPGSDKPGLLSAPPVRPASDKPITPVPAVSLKLPAHAAGTTGRLSDYAAPAEVGGDIDENKSRPLRLSAFMPVVASDADVRDVASGEQEQSVIVSLKHLWVDKTMPAAKHLWLDKTLPAARHLWIDQTVPAAKQFWSRQAVPAAKKLLSIPLLSPDPPQEALPPLYNRSNGLHSTQSVPAARKIVQTQSVPAIPPPGMSANGAGMSRRMVLGGLAVGVGVAGLTGVIATMYWQNAFQPAASSAPTPKPHQQPTAAPTAAATQAPTATPTPQNMVVLGPTRPTVTTWGPNQLDLFVRGTDGALWQRHYDGSWHPWTQALAGMTFDPTVTSWGAGRFDVFARGVDNTLQHSWYDGSWHPWESLGGALTSDPTAVSWGPNRLDIFARSVDNALWHKAFDGTWHDWERLDGVLLSSPSAATWGPNRLDVFVRGSDSALWHRGFDGSWHDWESLGGSFESDPAAVSIGQNHLDIFVRGAGNVLQRRSYDGNWHDWETLSGVLTTSPTTTTWGTGRIDVFARTANNVLQQTWYEGGLWQPWVPLT